MPRTGFVKNQALASRTGRTEVNRKVSVVHLHVDLQWSLSNLDTVGTEVASAFGAEKVCVCGVSALQVYVTWIRQSCTVIG